MKALSWIKLWRSPETEEITRDPKLFVLLAIIGLRARWRKETVTLEKLEIGEAMIGDHRTYGLSAREYRTRLARLRELGFVTIRTTNRGTIAKLIKSAVFDPFAGVSDEQTDDQTTSNRQTDDEQTTSNRQLTKKGNTAKTGKKERLKHFLSAADAAKLIPDSLSSSEEFNAAWRQWVSYMEQAGIAWVQITFEKLFAKLEGWGPEAAAVAIEHSIGSGARAIYQPTAGGRRRQALPELSEEDRLQ